MNYYEELGVSQEATGEEIRKAHRRLVKLMHPDAQLDQSLKGLAETQMRRLNSIVSTLLDSDQRRAYDDQLRNELLSVPASQDRGHWRGLPWWLLSAAGAVVLTLFAVWLWADHLSNNFGKSNHTIYVRPVENPPVAAVEKPLVAPDPPVERPSVSSDIPQTAKVEDAHNEFPPAPPIDARNGSSGISASVVPPDSHLEATRGNGASSIASGDAPALKPGPLAKSNHKATAITPLPVSVPHVAPKPVEHQDLNSSAAARTPPHSAPPVVTVPKPVVASTETQKKIFNMPPASVVANANTKPVHSGSALIPPPPGFTSTATRDETAMASAPLPALGPRPEPINIPSRSGASMRPRDPLEGEWVYAPKEPERRKPGFYPPEFIDLKLFSNGDSGNLKGQYSARYVIADKPIPPEVSFQLASSLGEKDSHKFTWQSTDGSKGTVAIHPVDDNTIRIEWRTTSAIRGPALTSGAATLVRRQ